MARKKLKTKRMDFHISETNFQKLLLLCNEERTFTEVLNECISGRYKAVFNTNDVITQEQKQKIEVANLNWLEGDNQ